MPEWAQALLLDLQMRLPNALTRGIGALVVLFIAWRLARAVRRWVLHFATRTRADVALQILAGRFLFLLVLLLGLVWSLDVVGVSPALLVTALGILGLAASLALQDILKNFCSGVYLLFERPFRIGDEISVRDFRGRVVDVGIRTTSIRTDDGLQVLIPNATVLAEVLTNRSTYRPPDDADGPPAPPLL